MEAKETIKIILKICGVFLNLYFFICSLDLLSTSFKLISGDALSTGEDLFSDDSILKNPMVGLMIGILGTVLLQSSSTFTSIIVAMTGSIISDPQYAVPMVMGANIGTSVTNTLVSLTQVSNREEFRRAFQAATIHDLFNWCAVIVLLPLEIATSFLYKMCSKIAEGAVNNENGDVELLSVITDPFCNLFVQVDSGLLTKWINHNSCNITSVDSGNMTTTLAPCDCGRCIECTLTVHYCVDGKSEKSPECWEKGDADYCRHMFAKSEMPDWAIGLIMLIISLTMLIGSLMLMVKLLNMLLQGAVADVTKKVLNPEFKYKIFNILWGYVNILIGCGLTFIVQSSSVFTSTLTPLVGIGLINIETVYPLFLGANLGTTTTAILASLTKTGDELVAGFTIALVHCFFNVFGILLFYPLPFMRFPIPLCKIMGNTTAQYRWFAIFYLIVMFFLMPIYFLVTSINHTVFLALNIPLIIFIVIIIIMNVLQRNKHTKKYLPRSLQNWDWLPRPLHSLGWYDSHVTNWSCCKRFQDKDLEDLESKNEISRQSYGDNIISISERELVRNSVDKS